MTSLKEEFQAVMDKYPKLTVAAMRELYEVVKKYAMSDEEINAMFREADKKLKELLSDEVKR